MAGLLIAGTVVFCAGVLTVVWGVPIKDFSFGNTLILVGVTVACTGLLLIGLSFVVRELKNIGRRLEASALRGEARADAGVLMPRVDLPSPSPSPSPELPKVARPAPPRPAPTPSGGFLFPRDEPRNRQVASENEPSSSAEDESRGEPSSPPWRDEALTRRASSLFPKAEEAAAETSPERPRRNFLFASRRRTARGEEAQDTAQVAEELPDLDIAREATDRAESSRRLEDSWSSERPRADAEDNGRPNGGRFPPFRRSEEPAAPAVTVVKSGVVDAMEYKLYSDGSIEAQMPEGMVRFESIDALRAHLGRND
jgi:hypothetical protein